jgi:16S rRNA (cytosine1402-N4)-methyltransferase
VTVEFNHQPVLLRETLAALQLRSGSIIVDGTTGGGSHSAAILEATAPDGIVICLDLDSDALVAAGERLQMFGDRVHLVRASFRELGRVLADLHIERVDGVLLDLGVSSHQLDSPQRGFRFADASAGDTPLDMRMDQSSEVTAASLIEAASPEELQRWFQDYGELPGSRRLAQAIVRRRGESPIETTADLLDVIREAKIGGGRRHNPATLVFQALRIAVNDELGALRDGLAAASDALRPGGRLVVIAYHSLEDRIVKHTFRDAASGCVCPPGFPVCMCDKRPSLRVVHKRPIRPGSEEIAENPRARSARLRTAERVEEAA